MKAFLSILLLVALLAGSGASEPAPGEPVGFRLTGHAEKYGQKFQFEIVMEGFDRYYLKEWDGDQEQRDMKNLRDYEKTGFWIITLVLGNFHGEMSQSWGPYGDRGGGHYGEHGGETNGEVARRLWSDSKFTAVLRENLRVELASGHYVEEFSEPIALDHFPLPCVILWTDNTSAMPEKTTRYTVEKVEIRYLRNPKFFDAAKAKYFPKANQP